MIGALSSVGRLPVSTAQMFDVNNAEVGEPVMIGAQGDEVGKVVCSALADWSDVMGVISEVKTADNAPMTIPQKGLVAEVAPFSALPISVAVSRLWVAFSQTVSVAIVSLFDLAGEQAQFAPAIGARDGSFDGAPGGGSQSLPSAVAKIGATSYANLRGPFVKGLTAYSTGALLLTAAIVAVVLASVLVLVDVAVLLAGVSLGGYFLAATAGAKDGGSHIASYETTVKYTRQARQSWQK
jgi:hypothetical protein